MGWSTRQLADLAGTSLRTVRHYHDVGLLAEPERRSNGYKSYRVEHLVRVMRIKRLSGLGFSLAQIAEMGQAHEYPESELRALDAELAGTIERLQHVRAELALVMRRAPTTELPPEMALAAAGTDMSEADRGLMVVWSRLSGEEGQASLVKALQGYRTDPVGEEFDRLPSDAGEETRRDLAVRLAPSTRGFLTAHPELNDPHTLVPGGIDQVFGTLGSALQDLYNPAQLDVLGRMVRLLEDGTEEGGRTG